MVEARLIALRQLAESTARAFRDAERATTLSPAEIAEQMENNLDRQRGDELEPGVVWK